MPISIPDTLTADNSEKYIVSIRLRSDGLSFSGYVPSVGESFFYGETEFDRSVPFVSSLKELFFGHEFFTWSFKKVQVVEVSTDYTFVPEPLFDEGRKDELFRFNSSSTDKHCLTTALKEGEGRLAFGLSEEIYQFCSRTLVRADFIHHVAPQLWLWKKQSQASTGRQMFVVLHRRILDIACYDQGRLLFVNSFPADQPEDALYYILHVWRQVGFDQWQDALYIYGNSQRRTKIITLLRTYIHHLHTLQIPSEAYLMGTGVFQASFDLIALLLCEL